MSLSSPSSPSCFPLILDDGCCFRSSREAFARSRSGVPSGLYGLCAEDAYPHCSRIFIRAFSSFFAVAEGSEL